MKIYSTLRIYYSFKEILMLVTDEHSLLEMEIEAIMWFHETIIRGMEEMEEHDAN